LASTAEWARGEEEYWAAELARLEPLYLVQRAEAILISTDPLRQLPAAVQRRLLRLAIERVKGSLRSVDFHHVEAIRGMMATREGSGRIQLPGLDVYRSFDWLRLTPLGFDQRLTRDFEAALLVPGRTEVTGRQLTIDMELVNGSAVYNKGVQALDWERCTGWLSAQNWKLRNWRPGDRYQPLGRSEAQKIKTLFQDSRVPLWERRTWPVVVGDAESGPLGSVVQGGQSEMILWSRRFGVASCFAAGPESRKILVIREVEGK
jgi:tRNA(Ile)-lysidine synthase